MSVRSHNWSENFYMAMQQFFDKCTTKTYDVLKCMLMYNYVVLILYSRSIESSFSEILQTSKNFWKHCFSFLFLMVILIHKVSLACKQHLTLNRIPLLQNRKITKTFEICVATIESSATKVLHPRYRSFYFNNELCFLET